MSGRRFMPGVDQPNPVVVDGDSENVEVPAVRANASVTPASCNACASSSLPLTVIVADHLPEDWRRSRLERGRQAV
jgi:hypothetical protein